MSQMNFSQLACPKCTYNCNSLNAKNCELCGTFLKEAFVKTASFSNSKSTRPQKDKPSRQKNSSTALNWGSARRRKRNSPKQSSNSSPIDTRSVKQQESKLPKQSNSSIQQGILGSIKLPKVRTIAKPLSLGAGILGGIGLLALGGIGAVTIASRIENLNIPLVAQEESMSRYGDIEIYDKMSEVTEVPEGLFSYGGALCFAALQRDGMNAAISNAHKQFRLRYVEPKHSNPGCTTGIDMLLTQELSIAQNSRPLTAEEINIASARGYELESVPVAIDGVVFYTNKSIGIKSLSMSQLRDIYLGKIVNWKEVGGKDLPITPISLDPKIDSLLKLVMKTEDMPKIGKNVVISRDYTEAIRETASTPGAISYASSAILKDQRSVTPIALSAEDGSTPVSALLSDGTVNLQAFEQNFYPLTRRLFVVIRRDGTPEEKAGVAYTNLLLSKEGQQIFQQAGFVPLYF